MELHVEVEVGGVMGEVAAAAAVAAAQRAREAAAATPDEARFQLELEFVQCLASPRYIHCALPCPALPVATGRRVRCVWCRGAQRVPGAEALRAGGVAPEAGGSAFCATGLAQNGYFDAPGFGAYLDYLQYWRRPEYARLLRYPHALAMLELLQDGDTVYLSTFLFNGTVRRLRSRPTPS